MLLPLKMCQQKSPRVIVPIYHDDVTAETSLNLVDPILSNALWYHVKHFAPTDHEEH